MPQATLTSAKHKKTATAFFRVSPSQAAIDAENGILKGVKLMEVGKLATFADDEGKPKSVTITDAHISALLAHAGNRAIPIHQTHEWFNAQGKENADSVELSARIGALKSFRKDENGDLIADAYFKAGKERDDIIWAAQHNPEDSMFSAVFNYAKNDPNCIPQNFRAADVVPCGAATTALFSADNTNNNKSMDISELIAALDDPKVKEALKAIIKSHKDASEEVTDTAEDITEAAAMESDAGVTDTDTKPEDDSKPAIMRAQLRIARVNTRLTAALKADRAAILAEAKTQAAGEATALLGKGGFIKQGEANAGASTYTATLAKFTAVESNPVKAAMLMLRKHPELQPQHDEATRARLAKLNQ